MKSICIIGASSGLGHRVAEDFARAGLRVAVAARREQPLRELQEKYPDNVVYRTLDITLPDAVERFNDLLEAAGDVETVLVASGVGFQNPDLDISREVTTLETNVVGWARIVAAAYRYFASVSNVTAGQIAAITSVAGTKGLGVAASYSASKRFQRNYLSALRQLATRRGDNIVITDIRPGFIRTPLLDADKNYPMLMTVDYVAPMIELAILKRRRVATVDWRWRLLDAAWAAIPTSWWERVDISLDK